MVAGEQRQSTKVQFIVDDDEEEKMENFIERHNEPRRGSQNMKYVTCIEVQWKEFAN